MKHVKSKLLIACIALTSAAGSAQASNDTSDDDWQFSLAPLFLWGMGIDGSTSLGPTNTPLNISFGDALDNLGAVFTFHFEAHKKDWGFFAEYQYVDLQPKSELENGSEVDVNFKNTMAELGVTYRVAQTERAEFQILGGARYVEQDLKVKGIPLPPLSDLKHNEHWWDAIIGGRVKVNMTETWSLIGRVDYGFGGSDGTWNLVGMVDYRFKGWGSVFAGYKWMDFDYSSGSGKNYYAYDARQQGPLAGLNFYW